MLALTQARIDAILSALTRNMKGDIFNEHESS
jgi:hypothetical protein